MQDWIGLLVIVAVLLILGTLCALKLRGYNPDGDKCEHGKRMPDEFCLVCGGTVEVNSGDDLDGETVGLVAFRAADEEVRRG